MEQNGTNSKTLELTENFTTFTEKLPQITEIFKYTVKNVIEI